MAQNPNGMSLLDPGQIIKRTFDPDNDRVRVDVGATIDLAGDLEVNLNATDDSIKVGDGTDFLAVNTDGSINVVIVSSTQGDSLYQYKKVTNLLASAVDDHTYTVVSGTFKITKIYASASGLIKAEILSGNTGVETTKMTFFNSQSATNIDFEFPEDFVLTVGQRLIVRILNRELSDQDVYSTIIGEEI